MQFDYTIHAENKLERPEVVQLGIDKAKVEQTIKKPITVDKSELPVISAGRLATLRRRNGAPLIYQEAQLGKAELAGLL